MSLINQMLKDLEARSAPQLDEHSDTIKGITWTAASKPAKKRYYIFAATAAGLLCTGIAVGGYYHLSNDSALVVEDINKTEIAATMVTAKEPNNSAVVAEARQTENNNIAVIADNDNFPDVEIVHKRDDTEARKMLAALVARGALVTNRENAKQPKKIIERPMVLALAENDSKSNSENNIIVRKKLRPLDNNKLAEIAYQQGYDHIARGQQAEAEKKLKHTLELRPNHVKAREMLAVLYLQQERVTDAADLLKQGISESPRYVAFREIYARVLMAQNQLPKAISMLREAAPDLNQYPNYHALLAGLYQQNKQHEEAAAIYLNLVKKNPQQSQWWLGMAIAMEKIGKKTEAISAYKKARELKLPAKLMKYANTRLQNLDTGSTSNQ